MLLKCSTRLTDRKWVNRKLLIFIFCSWSSAFCTPPHICIIMSTFFIPHCSVTNSAMHIPAHLSHACRVTVQLEYTATYMCVYGNWSGYFALWLYLPLPSCWPAGPVSRLSTLYHSCSPTLWLPLEWCLSSSSLHVWWVLVRTQCILCLATPSADFLWPHIQQSVCTEVYIVCVESHLSELQLSEHISLLNSPEIHTHHCMVYKQKHERATTRCQFSGLCWNLVEAHDVKNMYCK